MTPDTVLCPDTVTKKYGPGERLCRHIYIRMIAWYHMYVVAIRSHGNASVMLHYLCNYPDG